ncbi:MAG: HEAT repeat domain-containing protein [Chloroflexi bacterium]|nr:HEAT repeat domain-containing protein [Chloroflexota bacterium]
MRKWVSKLGGDEKYFVFTLGLFAGLDEKSFWKIYRGIVGIINELVSSKVGTPPLVDVRRSTIPYVTVSGNLEFSDPDYQNAVLNEIKERKEYLFEILPFLRDTGRKEGRESKVIRIAVALAVGEIGKLDLQEVEELVLREWAMGEDMSIRAAVGHCFKHIVEDSSKIGDVFSLIKEWTADEDWHIRWTAVSALGRIGRTKLGAALSQLRILARDENKEVRQGVAYVLARLGMSRQIRVERIMPILETLARDPEGEVRARVLFGLLDITRNKPSKRKTVLPNLKEWARDENKYARWVASRGLVEMSKEKQDDVLPIMKGLAKEEANIAQTLASVLAAALKGEFAEVLPRDILPIIKRLTQDEDEAAQLVAISALIAASEEKPEDILQILEEWIHSEDWRIRRAAVFVLVEIAVQINQERALGLLGALVQDENELVRTALLAELDRVELAKTHPESVASMMRSIARDEKEGIKLDAISILQTICSVSPSVTLPVLEQLSNDEDEKIRLTVVSLLQEVMPENPREALLILEGMAQDESPDVRLAVAQVVKTPSGVWPREVLPILTTLAGDENENVRKVVESGISEVSKAAPELISLILRDLARNENWGFQNALGCLSPSHLARFVWYRAFAGVPETLTEPSMVLTKPPVSEQKWYQIGETGRTFQREDTLLLGKGYPFSVKGNDDYLYYIISLRNEDSDTLRIYLACSHSYPETPPECAIELNDKEVSMDVTSISDWDSGCNLSEIVDEVVSKL